MLIPLITCMLFPRAAHNSKWKATGGNRYIRRPNGVCKRSDLSTHIFKHETLLKLRGRLCDCWFMKNPLSLFVWHLVAMHTAVALISIQSIWVKTTSVCWSLIWRHLSPRNTISLKHITWINFLAHSGWLFLAARCKAVNPKVKRGKHESHSFQVTDVM